MAKLSKTFEKFTREHQLQVIEVTAHAYSRQEAADLNYDDFEINLFINHKFIADISNVLAKTDALTAIVDDIDWEELYMETTWQQEEDEEVYHD